MRPWVRLWDLWSGPFRETLSATMDTTLRDTLFTVCRRLREEYPWQPLSVTRAWNAADAPLDDPRWTASPFAWDLLARFQPELACMTAWLARSRPCLRWLRTRNPPCPWTIDVLFNCMDRFLPKELVECVWKYVSHLFSELAIEENMAIARRHPATPAQRLYLEQEGMHKVEDNALLLCVLYGTMEDIAVVAHAIEVRESRLWEEQVETRAECNDLIDKYIARLFPRNSAFR